MTITIHDTASILQHGNNGLECRVWKGHTEDGVEVEVLIHRIAVRKDEDCERFERELAARPPVQTRSEAFPRPYFW